MHPSLHPSQRQVSDWNSQGYFLHLHPSAGKKQGMMTDNRGSRRIHTRVHAYSVPTRLLVGFAMSCICILGSRRMHMQMLPVLIVIKGHLPLQVFIFPSSSLPLFLSAYLSLAPRHSFSLAVSLSQPSPPFTLVTFSHLSEAATQLIKVYALSCEQAHTHMWIISHLILSVCPCLCPYRSQLSREVVEIRLCTDLSSIGLMLG